MNSRQLFLFPLFAMIVLVVAMMGCSMQTSSRMEMVKRGEYLVDAGSCNFCHTPKIWTSSGMELDTSRLLSGHREGTFDTLVTSEAMNDEGQVVGANSDITQWKGPWGVSFAANLTPDKTTGIGSWSEIDFIQTMRTGKHMGSGRKIQLPMPWSNIGSLTDADLKAIFAYLKSIKPVKNSVPVSILREADEAKPHE